MYAKGDQATSGQEQQTLAPCHMLCQAEQLHNHHNNIHEDDPAEDVDEAGDCNEHCDDGDEAAGGNDPGEDRDGEAEEGKEAG